MGAPTTFSWDDLAAEQPQEEIAVAITQDVPSAASATVTAAPVPVPKAPAPSL